MQNPFIPFLWGALSIFIGGQLIDAETTLGYILGIPICILGFLSLKHLGQRLIFVSSIKLSLIALVAMFLSLYLGNTVSSYFLSQIIIAVGLSLFITVAVQCYYKINLN